MNKFIYILFCLILGFSSFFGNAQYIDNKELLKKAEEALKTINMVVYKVDYSTKYLARRDTVHTTAVCSLYITSKDKMKSYNIVDLESLDSEFHLYGYRKYDGKKTLWVNYSIDSLKSNRKPLINSDKREMRSIVLNYSNLLLKEYFIQKRPFRKYRRFSDRILVTEEIHRGTPVYVMTIAFKDQGDIRDNVEKHYMRKSDFLPVAFYSFLKWENMEQYNYYEVEYLAINSDIPLEDFKVNENETINAEERYKKFKEKAKL